MDLGDFVKDIGKSLVKDLLTGGDSKSNSSSSAATKYARANEKLFESPRKPELSPAVEPITSAKMEDALSEWMSILTSYKVQ